MCPTTNQRPGVLAVRNWALLMSSKCGHDVMDRNTGDTYTWAQALMREVFGQDYRSNSAYCRLIANLEDGAELPKSIQVRMRNWRNGIWPAWARSGQIEELVFAGTAYPHLLAAHPERDTTRRDPTGRVVYRRAV